MLATEKPINFTAQNLFLTVIHLILEDPKDFIRGCEEFEYLEVNID